MKDHEYDGKQDEGNHSEWRQDVERQSDGAR